MNRCSPKLDWFQATIEENPKKLIGMFCDAFEGSFELGKGYNGYEKSALISYGENKSIFVMFDGNNGANPNVKVSGDGCDVVRGLIQRVYPWHSVTRIDSAIDFFDGDFDSLFSLTHEIAKRKGVKEIVIGDYYTDGAPSGRTVYHGSPSSRARLRTYEKGKEVRQYFEKYGKGFQSSLIPLNWVRVEAQIRPSKAQKEFAIGATAEEVFGMSKFVSEVYERVSGLEVVLAPVMPSKLSSIDESISFMVKQYKRAMKAKIVEMGGYSEFSEHLKELIFSYE